MCINCCKKFAAAVANRANQHHVTQSVYTVTARIAGGKLNKQLDSGSALDVIWSNETSLTGAGGHDECERGHGGIQRVCTSSTSPTDIN